MRFPATILTLAVLCGCNEPAVKTLPAKTAASDATDPASATPQARALAAMRSQAMGQSEPITEATLGRYIAALKALKARGLDANHSKPDLAAIDGVVRGAGFSGGYMEFAGVHTKIAIAFAKLLAPAAEANANTAMNSAVSKMEATLADPKVPETTKAAMRTQLDAMKKMSANDDPRMHIAAAIGGFTNPATLEVVRAHRAELEALYEHK